jgi:hypothetical protein
VAKPTSPERKTAESGSALGWHTVKEEAHTEERERERERKRGGRGAREARNRGCEEQGKRGIRGERKTRASEEDEGGGRAGWERMERACLPVP